MKKLIVNKKYNGKKLNIFLCDMIDGFTYSLFSKLLRKKDIKINAKRISKNTLVYSGDEIIVYLSDDFLNYMFLTSHSIQNIKTIYEDQYILVLDKPSGIEVTGNNSLTSIVHSKYSSSDFLPMPCHRLDRNTAGLILFAKSDYSLNILLDKFKNHEIEKYYYAWVYSIPKYSKQRLVAYLFKDSKNSRVYISDVPLKGYKKIITNYNVIRTYNNNTCLLDVQIETGKTHQIRAHLSHINLPIIGDGKYGINKVNKSFNKKTQCLLAYKLNFNFVSDSGFLQYLNGKSLKKDINTLDSLFSC